MPATRKFRDLTARVGRGERFSLPGELPKPLKPYEADRTRWKAGVPREFVLLREGEFLEAYRRDRRAQLEARAVPLAEVYGSLHERIFYKELLKRRIPFDFQSSMVGPRFELGTIISDFVLLDRPLIVSVMGNVWHRGLDAEARDVLQNDVLNQLGWEVYTIQDVEIEEEALLRAWFRRVVETRLVRPPTAQMLQAVGVGALAVLPTRLGVPPGMA